MLSRQTTTRAKMAAPATNEDDEVAALDRVLTRVAMADDTQLGAVSF